MSFLSADILHNLADGLVIIGLDHTIEYANAKMAELCGMPPAEITGRKCYAVFHGRQTPCADGSVCAHREVFGNGRAVTLRHQHQLPDGSKKNIAISASPLLDTEGRVVRLVQILRDVTVEEELRMALVSNHQILEAIFSSVPLNICYLDREMRVVRLNHFMEAMMGVKNEVVQGRHCYTCWGQYAGENLLGGEGKICDGCKVPTALRDGEKHLHERKIGDRVLEVASSPVRDANGEIIGALEIGRDITERYQTQEILRQSENIHRVLFEDSPNALCVADFSGIHRYLTGLPPAFVLDPEGFFRENPRDLEASLSRLRITRVNRAALALSGASSSEELISGLFTVIGRETVPQTAGGIIAISKGEKDFEHEIVLRRLDNLAEVYCILRWHVVPDDGGSYRQVILSLTDISARKEAETALNEHRAQLRKLSARLIEAEELERCRISREMHDTIGQQLAALGLGLNILEQEIPEEDSPLRKRIADLLVLLQEMSCKARDIMADLRPPVLDDYGLGAALRWYAELFTRRSGIACAVAVPELPRFGLPREMALFRVVQEALHNAVKHAGAGRVDIRGVVAARRLTLAVHDDGQGFPEDEERTGGYESFKLGLISMRERIEAAGGRLTIRSTPGVGTVVFLEVEM